MNRWLLLLFLLAVEFNLILHVCGRVVVKSANSNHAGAAVELTGDTFNSTLWAAPTTIAIVEFYAHWCPACQNFKPHYELVAQLFNGQDAPYAGILLMAKVDCAEGVNAKLCQRFFIKHYPTMLWGSSTTFAWDSRLSEKETKLEQITSSFNAQSVLDWINSKLDKSFSLDATKGKLQLTEMGISVGGQLPSLRDMEEATAESYDIILDHELVSSEHRAPFMHFLQLLAVHHPSRRCRAGSAQILFNLMDLFPAEHVLESGHHDSDGQGEKSTAVVDVKALKQFQICGEDLSHRSYKSCTRGTGGYSCGLWYLFHGLSVRVDDSESNTAVRTICDFIKNFFNCEECREHFLRMSETAIETISTRRALMLWLWRAHNEVNSRLAKVAGNSDVPGSKVQWPPKQLCTQCRMVSDNMHGNGEEEIEWDEDRVYQFLWKIYGPSLETVADQSQTKGTKHQVYAAVNGEDTTISAITVPVGAALCIAMASCGFGIGACCWRVQQKKRKHTRRRI